MFFILFLIVFSSNSLKNLRKHLAKELESLIKDQRTMLEMLKTTKATKVTRVRALEFQMAAVGIAKISGKMTTTTVTIEITTIDCMMTTGNL